MTFEITCWCWVLNLSCSNLCRSLRWLCFIESEAHFSQRAQDINLGAGVLRAHGIATLGTLAYAFGQPGQPLDEGAVGEWAKGIAGEGIFLGGLSALKRALFESQTIMLTALRDQVSNPDSQGARRLPDAEREKRMDNLKTSLVGVIVEGPLEPSHALLELCANQHQANQLQYIKPEKCTSRMHEITTGRPSTKELQLEANKLVVREHVEVSEMTIHNSLLLQEAFKRRGLAYVFSNSVSHAAYERYLQTLFMHTSREPPPGCQRCSLSQLVQADRMVFIRLIEENVKPRRKPDGTYPMDLALTAALQSYHVSFTLMPLPARAPGKPPADQRATPNPPAAKRLRNDESGKGKGKSKGKDAKGKSRKVATRYAILNAGGVATAPDGSPLCFDYVLEHCNRSVTDGQCVKGKHLCCVCFEPHSLKEHRKSA